MTIMRFALRAGLLALLTAMGGCAQLGLGEGPPAAAVPAPNPRPTYRPPLRVQAAAPAETKAPAEAKPPPKPAEPQIAMLEPETLIGMAPDAVTGRLGHPAESRTNGLSLVWRYAAEGCALTLYFYPDLKTARFHVLKFSLADADGRALDASAPCRRKLLAVRQNDAG